MECSCVGIYQWLIHHAPILQPRISSSADGIGATPEQINSNSQITKGTFKSDDLQDSPRHKVQAAAAKIVRSRSQEELDKVEWVPAPLVRSDSINSDALDDSTRHCMQAKASRLIRSHSQQSLDAKKEKVKNIVEMKESISSKDTFKHYDHATRPFGRPEACFEFESKNAFSDDEDDEGTPDHSKAKRGMWSKAWRFFAKPFKAYGKPGLTAVRGRIRTTSDESMNEEDPIFISTGDSTPIHSPKMPKCSLPEKQGLPKCPQLGDYSPIFNELNLNGLVAAQAFTLKPEENISIQEARKAKERSLTDPASLVGYQICFIQDLDAEIAGGEELDTVDESIEPIADRLRVVCAYERRYDKVQMRTCCLFLLMRDNGRWEWSELKRGPAKSGYRFTILRQVCI